MISDKKIAEYHPSLFEEAMGIKPSQIFQIISQDTQKLNQLAFKLFKKIPGNKAYIPQEACHTLNPTRKVSDHFLDIRSISSQALFNLCDLFQFPKDHLSQKPQNLSQGQCQLLAIMLAWHQDPGILIANQPFYALDTQKKENLIWLFNQHEKAIILLSNSPIEGLNTHQYLYCDEDSPSPPLYLKRPRSEELIIQLQKVILTQGPKSPITLNLYREITGLLGPNGSGKTTFLRTLMHSLPFQGHIFIQRQSFSNPKALYQTASLQMLFQNVRQSFHPEYPLGHILQDPSVQPNILYSVLDAFPPIEPWIDAYPKSRSLATLKTLALARILSRSPQYILLDEPLSGMSTSWQQAFFDCLLSSDIGVLIVDHDIDALHRLCNELYTIEQGLFRVV